MIPPCGTFEYVGEFSRSGFERDEIYVKARSEFADQEIRLVGHSPKVRFWNQRLILDATDRKYAQKSTASFPIGDVVERVANPGDTLRVWRTSRGGLGLSISRQERWVLGLGAFWEFPMVALEAASDDELTIFRESELGPDLPSPEGIGFAVGGNRVQLKARESAELEGYYIYVEHLGSWGFPGEDHCLAITSSRDWTVRNAALRSAILLLHGRVVMLDW